MTREHLDPTIGSRWPLAIASTRILNQEIVAAAAVDRRGRVTMEVFPGISIDPDIRFGKPCITGTRIDVATVVAALAGGDSMSTVADEYALSSTQVLTALAYAAHVAADPPAAAPRSSVAIDALAEGAGLASASRKRRDLGDIAGTWRADKAVEAALADQDRVDIPTNDT